MPEKENERRNKKISIGIDIGTTTISAVVYDILNKKEIEAYAIPHDSYVSSDVFSVQSVFVILDKAEAVFKRIFESYENIISIGLSGQMHGIVYIDSNGNPVSDLINWQDKRADKPIFDSKSACSLIKEITNEVISSGYGIATHYYNIQNGLVPNNAASFCSIMDLLGMRICGIKKPLVHSSVAASFGLFDVKNSLFKYEKLKVLGIERDFLPAVTNENAVIGSYKGVPIAVAIGDNQASFLGAVGNHNKSVYVNIGTGSQVSAVCDYRELNDEIELRPFIDKRFLACGSALCGGYAYSMVESFFRSYLADAGLGVSSQYEILNKLAQKAYDNGEKYLDVDVSFLGKRNAPDRKGSIINIERDNFTPSALVLGVLRGMCDELYGLYQHFYDKKTHIVASGGAVKKNNVLQRLLSDRFGMTVSINEIEEVAATGAALFSAYAVGEITYDNGFEEYLN